MLLPSDAISLNDIGNTPISANTSQTNINSSTTTSAGLPGDAIPISQLAEEPSEGQTTFGDVNNQTSTAYTHTSGPTVGGVGGFGAVPADKYAAGERNWLGNINDRPSAAVRGALDAIAAHQDVIKAAKSGWDNPGTVATYQGRIHDSMWKVAEEQSEGMPPDQARTYLTKKAFEITAAEVGGAAADIITNPLQVLTGIFGDEILTAGGKTIGAAKTAIAGADILGTASKFVARDLTLAGKANAELEGLGTKLASERTAAIAPVKDLPTPEIKVPLLDKPGSENRLINLVTSDMKAPDGSLNSTIGNLNNLNDKVSALIQAKRIGVDPEDIGTVTKFHTDLNNAIKAGARKGGVNIDQAIDAHSTYVNGYQQAKTGMTDLHGRAQGNLFKAAMKFNSGTSYKQNYNALAKFSPELQNIGKVMKTRSVLPIVGKGVGYAGGTYLLKGLFK